MRNSFKKAWLSQKDIWYVYLVVITSGFMLLLYDSKGDTIVMLQSYRSVMLDTVMWCITHIGSAWSLVIAAVIALFVRYRLALSILILSVSLGVCIATAKAVFGFPRPIIFFDWLGWVSDYSIFTEGHLERAFNSFPSGHTTAVFGLFVFLSLLIDSSIWKYIGLFVAMLVGLSRIYLGFHFLEDVLAGSILGSVVALTVFYVYERFENRTKWMEKRMHINFDRKKGSRTIDRVP